jgi:Mn2+/Fe2+ NRAMP family transporter
MKTFKAIVLVAVITLGITGGSFNIFNFSNVIAGLILILCMLAFIYVICTGKD